jgi:tetratricopeptide (TPR) repeat protein
LWLALGEARWWAGRLRDSKAAYRSAAEVADRLGARHELAQAAFGLAGRGNFGYGTPDEELVRVLERALEGLAEKDGALRAMLMSRLAVALASSPARERAAELAQAAIDMARRVGDKPALQFVLNAALHATWGPDDLAGRLEMSREIAHLGNEIGGAALVSGGNSPLHFLEAGDVAAAERETERRTAHTLRCRFCASWFEFGRARSALFEGRFDEVEGLNARVLAARRELQDEDSADSVLAQLVLLRREEGRLAEILPDVDGLAERYRALPFWRAALGWIYAELGREADARRELERLALADFAALRRDRDWLPCLAMLAEVVATLADVRRAGELYSLLLPYAERCIVSFGLSFGSAARSLGCLATTRGELGDAVRHFDDALAANARLGSPPWVAHTEYAYARTLLLRDESDDRARALELLGRAARTARELGMRALLGRIETLDLTVAEPRARGPRLPLAVETSVFRREGEYWTIAHAGTTIRIKDAKGLRYLALLLRHPEREFPALELVREASIPSGCFDPGPAADSGPILDDTSIEAYRRRLADLREELSEAEALADLGRTEKARAEIDALARALTSAVGLGGRRRRAGAAAERARLVVTKAIKASLRKIERGHPPLGRLLAAAIRTGTCCAYRPEPDRPVTWRF